jgi:small subunit ribosomal protein S17e
MGRIKTARIKRVTFELFRLRQNDVKKTFDENKLVVNKLAKVRSKKLRNVIAGYLTRLKNSNRTFETRNY